MRFSPAARESQEVNHDCEVLFVVGNACLIEAFESSSFGGRRRRAYPKTGLQQ